MILKYFSKALTGTKLVMYSIKTYDLMETEVFQEEVVGLTFFVMAWAGAEISKKSMR
jgi:hypothetical protein